MNVYHGTLSKLKENLTVIVLITTVLGMGFAFFNFLTINSLSPIIARLDKIDISVQAVTAEHKDIKTNYPSKEEINIEFSKLDQRDADIIHRLDIISTRLDKFILK